MFAAPDGPLLIALAFLPDTAPPSQSQPWRRGLMCVSLEASCSQLQGIFDPLRWSFSS